MKLISAVLVGLLVVVVAAGCGGSSKKAATTSAATTTEETTTEETTTEAMTSSTGMPNFTSEDCQKLMAASEMVDKAFSGTVSEGLDEDVARLAALAEQVPDEIKPDFETLAQAAQQVAELGLEPGKQPTPAQIQALSQMDVVKISAAAQHISEWVQKSCMTQ
jgi:hypothetical protein